MKLNAHHLANTMQSDIEDPNMCGFKRRQPLNDPCFAGIKYIPKRCRRHMYKSFAEGFQEIVEAIANLLEQEVFPTEERILKKAMPDFMLPGSNAFHHKTPAANVPPESALGGRFFLCLLYFLFLCILRYNCWKVSACHERLAPRLWPYNAVALHKYQELKGHDNVPRVVDIFVAQGTDGRVCILWQQLQSAVPWQLFY